MSVYGTDPSLFNAVFLFLAPYYESSRHPKALFPVIPIAQDNNLYIQNRISHYDASEHCKYKRGAGILTGFSIGYASRPRLRPASPPTDHRCRGTLRLAVGRVLTFLYATYANILTSVRSTGPHGSDFTAYGTLLYHYSDAWALPMI